MNKFVYFMAVGLAFTVLQVATVEAQDTAAGLVTGGTAPAECRDAGGAVIPCPTGDPYSPSGGKTESVGNSERTIRTSRLSQLGARQETMASAGALRSMEKFTYGP